MNDLSLHGSNRTIYLIIDGMTETVMQNSTLSLARTPVINGLVNERSIIGFYDPVIRPGDAEPKTDVVVPCYFGLPAHYNPGRTALELLDNGVKLKAGMLCVEVKVRFDSQADEDNWVKLKKVPDETVLQLEADLMSAIGHQNFVISKATEAGARILFYFKDLGQEDEALSILPAVCKKHGLIAVKSSADMISEEFLSFADKSADTFFLGWAKGSLRGALRFCGLRVNEFSRKRDDFYNWSSYNANFDEWRVPVLQNGPAYQRYVLYTKESAFAARRGDQDKKREAIEFMDTILGRFLAVFPEEVFSIVVLSDHSADIGGNTNPSTHTSFAILQGGYRDIISNPLVNFSETFIAGLGNKLFTQEEVISFIGQDS